MLLERLEPHIFHGHNVRPGDVRAALRSLWKQGVLGSARFDYFRMLAKGWRRDAMEVRSARKALVRLQRHMRVATAGIAELPAHLDRARDAMIRADRSRRLDEIDAWVQAVRARFADGIASSEDLDAVYRWSSEFFLRRQRLHRFPGAHLVKAFNLAIKGLHYQTVMHGLAREGLSGERVPHTAAGAS